MENSMKINKDLLNKKRNKCENANTQVINKSIKTRNSSIELLKIIAMIMIVISHFIPTNLNIYYASMNINNIIGIIFKGLGQLGNAIFIICSAWFLIESKSVKSKKVLTMMIDCFIISIGWMIIALSANIHLPTTETLKKFMPITFEINWFIGCYLIMYIFHPLLNMIILNISKQKHLLLCIGLFLVYGILNSVKFGLYYANRLTSFFVIYFFIAYVKRYLQKTIKHQENNFKFFIIGIVGWIGTIITMNFAGLKIHFLYDKMQHWNYILNPFLLLIAFSLFFIATNKNITNKQINLIASLTLLIYLIHENPYALYFRDLIYKSINHTFGMKYICLWIIVLSIATFIITTILAYVYSISVGKIVTRLATLFENIIGKIYNKTLGKLLRFD